MNFNSINSYTIDDSFDLKSDDFKYESLESGFAIKFKRESEIVKNSNFNTINKNSNGYKSDFINIGSTENNNIDFYNSYYSKTQNWIGHVEKINKDSFIARLKDLTNHGTDEICEFEIDEISEEDFPLIKIGAAFYWSIGFSNENGQRSKKSLIRFQRLSNFTNENINSALDRANDLIQNLNWD